MIFRGSSGSAAVEGAMVFALVLSVVFGFIYAALDIHVAVRDDAIAHKEAIIAQDSSAGAASAVRTGWIISFAAGGDMDGDEESKQE